ncbi:MAG TPA: hypothetical protein PK821_01055 [Victivallales bacterium]|nr:hypothetical protein [Victivallales bacterium]
MGKIKKILLILAVIFIIFLIIAILVSAWLASAVFDKSPLVSYQPHIPDHEVLASLVQKLSGEQDDQEGIDIKSLLLSDSTRDVLLNEKEVNEIIMSGIETYINSGDDQLIQKMLKPLKIEFSKGLFTAFYSLDSGIRNPFGKYINFTCVFVPRLSNREISIEIKQVKAGSLPIAASRANHIVESYIRETENAGETSEILDAIKEIKVEGSSVRLKYSLLGMMKLIMKQSGINSSTLALPSENGSELIIENLNLPNLIE